MNGVNDFINRAAPLSLAVLLSLPGVTAALINSARQLTKETEYEIRRKKALHLLLEALPGNLFLALFSFDIWVITTLFSADTKTLEFYNLSNKESAIQLLIVIHMILYIFVLAWGGLVRGNQDQLSINQFLLEILLALIALVLCILFQAY